MFPRRSLTRTNLATALLIAALPAAQAAGYYTTDIGTRGMSRGGAYIAGNRDLSVLLARIRQGCSVLKNDLFRVGICSTPARGIPVFLIRMSK